MEEIGSLSTDTKAVTLKYIVERVGTADIGENGVLFPKERVRICYGTENDPCITAMEMTAMPGRWTGTKAGFFCVSGKDGSKGSADLHPVYFRRLRT